MIGEGGSGGAIAIAVADRVLMQENAIYSVISPEGCAAILWRDASQAKKAASAFKPDAAHCLELGVIDGIVPEPEGGAQVDHDAAAVLLREAVVAHLDELDGIPPDELRRARRAKFRSMGVCSPEPERSLHTFHRLIPGCESGDLQGLPSTCDEGVKDWRCFAERRRPWDDRAWWPSSTTTGASAIPRGRRSRSAAAVGRRAGLRDPAARRPAPALRPAARAGRRARELGRAEGPAARGRRAASRGARRGPPARLRHVRGRDPGRPVRRRHGRDLGPGDVRAARGEAGRRPDRTAPRRAARRRLDARPRPPRRRRAQLAAAAQGRAAQSAASRTPPAARDARPTSCRPVPAGSTSRSGTATARSSTLRGGVATLHEPQRQRPHRALPRRSPARVVHAVRTPSAVLDGEVCALDETGPPGFESLQRAAGRLVFVVFDVLELRRRAAVDLRPSWSGGRLLEELARPGDRRRAPVARLRRRAALLEAAPASRASRASSRSAPTRRTAPAGARPSGRSSS